MQIRNIGQCPNERNVRANAYKPLGSGGRRVVKGSSSGRRRPPLHKSSSNRRTRPPESCQRASGRRHGLSTDAADPRRRQTGAPTSRGRLHLRRQTAPRAPVPPRPARHTARHSVPGTSRCTSERPQPQDLTANHQLTANGTGGGRSRHVQGRIFQISPMQKTIPHDWHCYKRAGIMQKHRTARSF